jgi:hypothetical protein
MKASSPWITYRTRFLVKAKQLTTSLAFTDVLGRQHSGRKGDYLVESSDGVLRIAPRQIFEDIYVPLAEPTAEPEFEYGETLAPPASPRKKPAWPPGAPSRPREIQLPLALTRKSPQPDRGRNFAPGINSL